MYQHTLSPDKGIPRFWLKGRVCTHEPHCSEYTKQCIKRYGFFRGMGLGMERVSHCVPRYQKVYDPPVYKVVFFSGAPIGIPFLETLHQDKRFDLVGIVTMPDAPSGRGMNIKENTIASTARKIHQASSDFILKPKSLKKGPSAKEIKAWLERKQIDFIVVVAYGKIIPQSILDIPYFGSINVHGSLLPKYRGASPLQSVFLHDEKETGLTIMLMNDKLDEGDILDTKKIPLTLDMTVKDLIQELKAQGPKFLTKVLWERGKGRIQAIQQNHTQATTCKKIEKTEGLVDIYKDTLQEIYNKYRAYILWPKIYFIHHNKRIIVEELIVDEGMYQTYHQTPLFHKTGDKKGNIYSLNPAIRSCRVKPEGKKKMDRVAFERGYMK